MQFCKMTDTALIFSIYSEVNSTLFIFRDVRALIIHSIQDKGMKLYLMLNVDS
ncbi:hypothetical protein S2091_0502 [Solimicrobium silvestre]|uniref:Uncharacterized protein n=1 Tax=Solimicrobium silvestre TaxID=2099400 RepID=A0A2S9H3E2_9BURK|nr:hypothetical protein S2091_0502 [Solimicrobium silvestre]